MSTLIDRLSPPRTHHAYRALRGLVAAMEHATSMIDDPAAVLDYGCGDMPYRPLFVARGATYIGADVPGNSHADLVIVDGRIPVADASFDVVLSTQVLEHVPDPVAYLAEARRVLRSGGTFLLSTHGVWPYHPHPGDYWRWTREGLVRVVEDAGFTVRESSGILGPAATGIQLWQDAMLRVMPAMLHKPLILLCQSLMGLHERMPRIADSRRDAAIYVLWASPKLTGTSAGEE